MNVRAHAVALAAILGLFAADAVGAPLAVGFRGILSDFSDAAGVIDDAIGVGTPFVGQYTFDPAAPDDSPEDPNARQTRGAGSIRVEVGPHVFESVFESELLLVSIFNDGQVEDPVGSGNFVTADFLFAFSSQNTGNVSPQPTLIALSLVDSTATAIDSDAFPVPAPMLDDWDQAFLSIENVRIIDGALAYELRGNLTELFAVPEPAALTLVLLGLGGLAAHARHTGRARARAARSA